MSLRKLAARMKPRAAAQGQANEELERARRAQEQQREQSKREADKLRAEAETARKQAAEAQAEAARVRIESAVTSAASKARALNPGHVAQLLGNKVKLVDGKLTVDGSDKDVDAYVAEWLGSEGKHFLPASVPSGGSGASGNPNPPPAKAAHDLSTKAGMTAYARDRELNARRPGQAPRAQSATAPLVAPPATTPAQGAQGGGTTTQ